MKNVAFSDQRSFTDEEFLGLLRVGGVDVKDLAAARSAVARRFRERPRPHWAYYMHGAPWIEIDGRGSVLANARGLLAGRFRNHWTPASSADMSGARGGIDWSKAPPAFATSLSRNAFVSDLSTAFALTGDVRYVRRAVEIMRSFVEEFPFVLDEGFLEDHDRFFGGQFNNTLCVVYRCLRWTDLLHCGALQCPGAVSDEDVFWMLKQICFYALQLHRLTGDRMRRDNHHLVDHGHGPFAMGTAFPEFSFAREFAASGRRVIRHHMRENIYADSAYAEHSTKYQYHISFHYLHACALADVNGLSLFSKAERRRLAGWVGFFARAAKPDGILAEFGDERGGSLEHLFGVLSAPVMAGPLAAVARSLGYEPGRVLAESPADLARKLRAWRPGSPTGTGLSPRFDRRARAQVTRQPPPEPASARYPNGGFTFLRSEWSPDADFMAVSHYTDSMPHGHAHWDMMSFVLHTQGRTLIGDPATSLYGGSRRRRVEAPAQERRGYLYSVDSHNCLVVNDDTLKPLAAFGHWCFWGGHPPRHGLGLFEAGGRIEAAELWHDAYAPIRHRRFVVQVKGVGFILVDILGREGDLRPHQYSQRLHFERGVRLRPGSPDPGGSLRASLREAQCVIVPGAEAETVWKTWRDRWLAEVSGSGKEIAGPHVAELTRRQEGRCVFTTFIVTRPSRGLRRDPVARYLGHHPGKSGFHQHEMVAANALDLGRHGRLLVASCPYGRGIESKELSTDAELAVALLDRHGRIESWCMARGSRLLIRGKAVCSGRRSEWRSG